MVATLRTERKTAEWFKRAARTVKARRRSGLKVKAGYPLERVSADIVARAIFNEFGTRTIPERPFMRNAINGNRSVYRNMIRRYSKPILRGQMTERQALELIGAKAVGDIQESIRSNTPPPNAPATVERKGSSSTLIDTGEMRQATSYWIEKG